MIQIVNKRYLYFAISLLVIVPGIVILILGGLPLSLDFTGGDRLVVQFAADKTPQPAELIKLYEDAHIEDAQVQTT